MLKGSNVQVTLADDILSPIGKYIHLYAICERMHYENVPGYKEQAIVSIEGKSGAKTTKRNQVLPLGDLASLLLQKVIEVSSPLGFTLLALIGLRAFDITSKQRVDVLN